jgi:alanine dehydrogenase
MVGAMKKGAVVVDVAVDQGGCIETSRPTTHSQPTFEVGGVVHYCVANMPGAVPRTSTFALTNVTLPYLLQIANKGLVTAVAEDRSLAAGVNTYRGRLTCRPVAEAQGLPWTTLSELLGD